LYDYIVLMCRSYICKMVWRRTDHNLVSAIDVIQKYNHEAVLYVNNRIETCISSLIFPNSITIAW